MYADFEWLTKKILSTAPSSSKSFTQNIETHQPVSYTLIALNAKSKLIFHEYFVGENAVDHFLTTLKSVANKLITLMKKIIPLREGENYESRSCIF